MKRYKVSWGELSQEFDASDPATAWSMFCDFYSASTPDLQRHPKLHGRVIVDFSNAAQPAALDTIATVTRELLA